MNQSHYAIIVSEFNAVITEQLLIGAKNHLLENGITNQNIHIIKVPGAVEIPFTANLLALQKKYRAIIALGCIIRGDTDHYDYVCQQVSFGCQKVMLETMTPIIFGILTTHTEEQAHERIGGIHGHKGIEAAQAALTMTKVVQENN